MRALIVSFIALSLAVSAGGAQPKPSAAVALVRQLYADFACEAVLEEPDCDARHQLMDQPRAVLSKYFDDRLTGLWLADRECSERSHEICNLDFSPIWASQDPPGTTVHVRATKDPNIVEVEVQHASSSEKAILRYMLVKTSAGVRIHDIMGGKEWSLVAVLSRK